MVKKRMDESQSNASSDTADHPSGYQLAKLALNLLNETDAACCTTHTRTCDKCGRLLDLFRTTSVEHSVATVCPTAKDISQCVAGIANRMLGHVVSLHILVCDECRSLAGGMFVIKDGDPVQCCD